jgi:hypothetical protein
MNLLASITNNAKTTIVVEFFPGVIASWPWVLLVLKWYQGKYSVDIGLDPSVFKNGEFVISLILLIALYGIGHIISKFGLRLEVWLDKYVIRRNRLMMCLAKNKNSPTAKTKYFDDTEFTKVWYSYLRKSFHKDNEPTIMRYYSGFISAFKFELNMTCALFFMLVSLYFLEGNYLHVFANTSHYVAVNIAGVLLMSYFIYESIQAIYTQHELRKNIIKAWKTQFKKV